MNTSLIVDDPNQLIETKIEERGFQVLCALIPCEEKENKEAK